MSSEVHAIYEFNGFRLDPRRRLLVRLADGTAVAVTPKAFDALVFLVERAGELLTRQTLSKKLWPATVVEENNLTQAVAALRRVLGEGCIATVPGRGYQFVADVRRSAIEPESGGSRPPAADPSAPGPVQARGPRRPRYVIAAAAAAAAVAAAAVAVGLALFEHTGPAAERVDDDPFRSATFSRLTDFDGAEEHAAISRDGRFVAFLSDRDGTWDVWVGQVDSGDFRNVTGGAIAELRNPAVRTLGFTPDGLLVTLWTKNPDAGGAGAVDGGWAIPTIGGPLKPYRPGIAELDWSPDGRRIAYHTSERGDPLFVTAADDDTARQIYAAPEPLHSHFPLWSLDGASLYFVRGQPPDEMDLWRMPASGGEPERLTSHRSRVSFPTWLDERTLLYLATDPDGSGPWIHALDVTTSSSRRLNTAGVEYSSLAATADGRRLVATAARSTGSLWRIALGAAPGAPLPLAARPLRGSSPRLDGDRVIYRAPRPGASADGIWRLRDGVESELWSGADGRVVAGPAVAPDGRVAFAVRREVRTTLYAMAPDGSAPRVVAADLDVRGAPAWSPDGAWLAVGAVRDGVPRLFKVPADGGAPVQLGDGYALDPVWAPSGAFLVYSGADVGTNFPVAAVNADGTPHPLPELVLSRGSRRMDFLDGDRELVILKGSLSHKEFWAFDLDSGAQRLLAAVDSGTIVSDFDVAAGGHEIVFDRISDASDIVLIDLAPR